MKRALYKTDLGKMIVGDSIELYSSYLKKSYQNKVNLIITSPPFPLNSKKMYGNLTGKSYLKWFTELAPIFSDLLADDGSLVIEIGNAWEPKRPIQSLLHLKSLLALVENKVAGLRLIQEFIAYNPAKLPSPAQWVTINRIRTVDSYTHVWWIAKSDFPKADNTKTLRPYSKSMKHLLKEKKYNSGKRPSEHNISAKGFTKNNGGSIAHNFFELDPLDNDREVRLPHNVLSFANTSSNDYFLRVCRERGIVPHPARMNGGLVSFFIELLTEENDLIFDPFAGSNTTGYCAEKLNRRWLSIEANKEYANSSLIRFENPANTSAPKQKKA